MPNLTESLIASFGGGFDKAAEESMNSVFLNQKGTWINKTVNDYMKYNTAPDVTIGKIAKEASLNDEQIKRLSEETNVQIYLQKYASVKQKDVRYVEFPLANSEKVISSLGRTKDTAEKVASLGDSIMEKVASIESNLNYMTNSQSYEPSLWDAEKVNLNHVEMLKRDIMKKTASIAIEQEQLVGETFNKIASFGEGLIQLAFRGHDAQGIFDKIACDLDLSIEMQELFKLAVDEKLSFLQEERYIPKNFMFKLATATSPIKEAYSLGKHSILHKEAQDVIVEVKDANLADGRSFASMARLATEIKSNLDNPILLKGTPVELAGGHTITAPKED